MLAIQTCYIYLYIKSKMHSDIGKGVINSHLGSNPDPCYIQNCVIMNCVVKRFRCTMFAANNKGTDQTVEMCRLICVFIVPKMALTCFLMIRAST